MLNLPIQMLAIGLLLLPAVLALAPVLMGAMERAKQGPRLKYVPLATEYHYRDETRTLPTMVAGNEI